MFFLQDAVLQKIKVMQISPKSAGIALISGCLLLVLTMILHPVGGNVEHLIKITTLIIITHSIAIASIPVLIFGFWGLTQYLADRKGWAIGAFIIMTTGLFAVMLAATVNGLVLPFFVNRFQEAIPETIDAIRPILQYNQSLNHAFDYIFMGASCLAILLWSVASLQTKKLSKWMGYFGLLLSIAAMLVWSTGFNFVDLGGFRYFTFSMVSWILSAGFLLCNLNRVSKKTEQNA